MAKKKTTALHDLAVVQATASPSNEAANISTTATLDLESSLLSDYLGINQPYVMPLSKSLSSKLAHYLVQPVAECGIVLNAWPSWVKRSMLRLVLIGSS